MPHDFSLHSGERQTATSYGSIRADHRFRYEWADRLLPAGGFGIDAFCGNGYGAWLLSSKRVVWGIDGSSDAIRLADEHFRTPSCFFSTAKWPFAVPDRTFDFIVALESVEHVEDGAGFFEALANSLKPGGSLLFSTPCQDRLPLEKTGNHFHFKHYRLEESNALAQSNNLELLDWAGQDTYQIREDGWQGPVLADEAMALKPREAGQFVMYHCRKRDF